MTSDGRKTGRIIRILRDKAYGFIKVEGDRDYFFHQNALRDCTLDDLRDGSRDSEPTQVTFVVTEARSGKLQAEDVRIDEEPIL